MNSLETDILKEFDSLQLWIFLRILQRADGNKKRHQTQPVDVARSVDRKKRITRKNEKENGEHIHATFSFILRIQCSKNNATINL